MMMKRRYKIIVLSICTLFCVSTIFSQTPVVKTSVDKTEILIGEQIQYNVKVELPSNLFKLQQINKPDTFPHFELMLQNKLDTLKNSNGMLLVQQNFIFTSFDSGKFALPSMPVIIVDIVKNATYKVFTDSAVINVGYAAADTTNKLRDIKPIIDVTINDYFWYYIGAAILGLLLLVFFVWRYFKKRKRPEPKIFDSSISPYDEAMKAITLLQKSKLSNAAETNEYHTQLSFILKWYITRVQGKSIMHNTTSDVLVLFNNSKIYKENVAKLASILRCNDAVKFAKYLPATSESEDSLTKTKELINYINTNKTLI
jgi:hypothetical protein